MKTKHLFFATALVASFASCSNEEIVEQQGVANVERPTVENVKLNFVGEGVDSRLAFGSNGYAWEADDVIGALNMDQPASGNKWSTKYELKNFINTSYPFTYDAEADTWGTPGKMLEGNYFFAFPFADYDGERFAKYSLINQQQNGIKGAVVAQNYAKNQIFIGYTPIKKGNGFDILTDIEMTSLLGAIQLRIVNDGDKTYHINKVVVRSNALKGELVLDPTSDYTHKYNVSDKFSPVNYLGKDFEGDEISSAVKTDIEKDLFKAERMEALRDVAKYQGENFAQLFISGAAEEREIAKGATAYALIMTSPADFYAYDVTKEDYSNTLVKVNEVDDPTLLLDIYTDEGIIEGVNLLTAVKGSVSARVNSTKPGVANTIVVTFDDEDVKDNKSLNVYTEEDLAQLLSWNLGVTKKASLIATLMEDVTLTKEAFELLKSNDKLTLNIVNKTSGTEVLTIAEDVPADVLAYEGLVISTAVEAEGTVNFTKKSQKISSITALEGATLHIAENSAEVPVSVNIEEGAELTMVENASVSGAVIFNNKGTMTVAKGGNILGTVNNKATLNINGKVNKLNNTAIVNMGEAAVVEGGTNMGTEDAPAYIYTAANSKVKSTQDAYGRIKYVATATIDPTGGYVFDELTTATLAEATYKNKNVNLFILKGGEITISENLTLDNVEVAEGAVAGISVAKAASATDTDKTLTISTSLKVNKGGKLTTNGNITLNGTTTIVKDAEWTNNATVSVGAAITNTGVVYNHGTMEESKALTHTGVAYTTEAFTNTWKITGLKKYEAPLADKQDVMDDAVKAWLTSREATDLAEGTNYNGNPYSVEKFVTIMNAWKTVPSRKAIVDAFEEKWVYAYSASNTTKAELVDEDGVVATEFTTAVNNVLDVVAAKVKALLINKDGEFTVNPFTEDARNSTLWKNQEEAYNHFRNALATNANVIAKVADVKNSSKTTSYVAAAKDWTVECIAAAAWRLSAEDIEAAMAKTTMTISTSEVEFTYFYIWEGCELDEVMDVYRRYKTAAEWATVDSRATLIAWMDMIVASKESSIAIEAAKTVVAKHYENAASWMYNADQVKNAGLKGTAVFE